MTSGYYNYNYGGSNNMGMGQYFNPQQQMTNLINQHPQYFNQAMQQAVQPQQQIQQQTPQQNTITTQPPIMQPTADRNSAKMLYVGNREEATAHPVDLVYSTPTFFFNRGTNEIYMKQYDGTTGNAIFKIYTEQIKPIEKTVQSVAMIPNDNAYINELKMIRAGVEGLYRYFNQPQAPIHQPQYKKEDEVIDVDFAVSQVEENNIEKPRQVISKGNNKKNA